MHYRISTGQVRDEYRTQPPSSSVSRRIDEPPPEITALYRPAKPFGSSVLAVKRYRSPKFPERQPFHRKENAEIWQK
jgi:hypothetical protein